MKQDSEDIRNIETTASTLGTLSNSSFFLHMNQNYWNSNIPNYVIDQIFVLLICRRRELSIRSVGDLGEYHNIRRSA